MPIIVKLESFVDKRPGGMVSRATLQMENVGRKVRFGPHSFVRLDDLCRWTCDWVRVMPAQYDLIVGIPRSGLVVASMIAVKLGKPLSTPDCLQNGVKWMSERANGVKPIERILIVEDATSSGKLLAEARGTVKTCDPEAEVTCASLIITKPMDEELSKNIDLYYKEISGRFEFEWTLMHGKYGVLAIDLDGVICESCPADVSEDEAGFVMWMGRAKPYLVPAYEVDHIVTDRPEKYRPQTEEWLKKNRVSYKYLHMREETDRKTIGHESIAYKIETIVRVRPDMIFEDDPAVAKRIWKSTGVPTLCIRTMHMFT